MLHNNNYSYQALPSNYTFDLKVNVDFNSGKINLGVPTPPPPFAPFAKKQEVPLIHPQPVFVNNSSPYQSAYTPVYPSNQVSVPQPPSAWQSMPNYARPQLPYNSAYSPQQIEQSYLMRYSDKQKARSANDTYPETSFSMGIERSMDAVECVICDKPVSRQQFHNHLEQHKNRRREQNRKQIRQSSQAQKLGSFSVRNQNSLENIAQLYREIPSRATQTSQLVDKSMAKLQHSDGGGRSRGVQETHSRIVYAPRDPSQIVSASSHSEFAYSHSFGSDHSRPRENQRKPVPQQTNGLQQDTRYQQNMNYNHNSRDSRESRSNKGSSLNLITSQVSRRQDSNTLSQNKQPIKSYYQQNSRSSAAVYRHPQNPNHSNNYSNFDRTDSRIITSTHAQQKKKQPSFEDIEQSVIHRINDLSRDYSILQLKKQLNISQIQQESSSDEEGHYLSVRGNPPTQIYQSVSRSKQSVGMSSSSNMTEKLTRTKLPVNYLAREDFIVNTMLTRSCYKSKHSSWK